MLVRPEAVVVTPDPDGDATVVVATFRGSSTRLRLLLVDGSELLADVASHRSSELSPGSRASVACSSGRSCSPARSAPARSRIDLLIRA